MATALACYGTMDFLNVIMLAGFGRGALICSMKPFHKIDKSRIVKKLINIELESLKRIYEEHIVEPFNGEIKRIERINTDNEEYMEVLAEEFTTIENDLITVTNLFCVALWGRIESLLNMLGKHANKGWNETHGFDRIKKGFNKNEIALAQMPYYSEMNVLREINNSVKHAESIVTKNLQDVSQNSPFKFKKGDEIQVTSQQLLNFFENGMSFLSSVVEQIKAKGRYD